MMESQMVIPREGHLEVVLHVFTFLRQKYNSRMSVDPTYPIIDMNALKECKWKYFYGDLKGGLSPTNPEERKIEVDLRGYVGEDHARENKTRRSRSGFLIFLNTALIQWLSNKAVHDREVCFSGGFYGHEDFHGYISRDEL